MLIKVPLWIRVRVGHSSRVPSYNKEICSCCYTRLGMPLNLQQNKRLSCYTEIVNYFSKKTKPFPQQFLFIRDDKKCLEAKNNDISNENIINILQVRAGALQVFNYAKKKFWLYSSEMKFFFTSRSDGLTGL